MSRCFPFPPPGYDRKVAVECLIESIKLQKERQKAKNEGKEEKKREKKEKGKESRKKDGKMDQVKPGSEKRHKDERSHRKQKVGNYKERRDEEIEQAAKSNLTEEHGQAASTQNFYNSFDSLPKSGKRKKHDTAADSCHDHGFGLRIRLSLSKHTDSVPPSSSHRTKTCSEKLITACKHGLNDSVSTGMEAQYRDLIGSWNAPLLDFEHPDFDNQEWLFKIKQQCKHDPKRRKINDSSVHVNLAGWVPHACFLPADEVYALPYVVPY